MLCNTPFGDNLRVGFRALRTLNGSQRFSTDLKDTLHVNIQTYKDFFLFYRSTYSTVGYPK